MNKKQKLALGIGGFFLIPLLIVLALSISHYLSSKNHEQATATKAMGQAARVHSVDLNHWSFQERTEYLKNLTPDEVKQLGSFHDQANRALGWISVTGVLICFVAGFVALAIFLAAVPRVR
jgi:hypothetical protein